MKFYFVVAVAALLFTSCLKQSIPDAMLASELANAKSDTARLSCEVNGNYVSIIVGNAGKQNPSAYTLGCSNLTDSYVLFGNGDIIETRFLFLTNNLTKGVYTYVNSNGPRFLMSYNGENEWVQAASDYLSITITSDNNGRISGTFSGELSTLISNGSPNTYGPPGAIKITNGSFQNIPVFN